MFVKKTKYKILLNVYDEVLFSLHFYLHFMWQNILLNQVFGCFFH